MNFVMKEILVQSDLVSVVLSFDYFLLNIYIYKNIHKHLYIDQNIINSRQIYNTINIPIKQFLRHFCEY